MASPFEAKDDRTKRASPSTQPRAGLRPDERDPDEPAAAAGSAGGGEDAAGTPGGGLAAGGLGGTNAPSGGVEDEVDELNDAMGDGTEDVSGSEEVSGGPPYAGPSGGAVGGTPAGRRVSGGDLPSGEGLAPQGDIGDDRTLGSSAKRPTRKTRKANKGNPSSREK